MRSFERFVCIALLGVFSAAGTSRAQSPLIRGPLLGFTPSFDGTAISPVIGISGASVLASPLHLNGSIRGAVIAPKQDYAVAVRTDDSQVVVIDLASAAVAPVAGVNADNFVIAISPAGASAAVYDGGSASVYVIGNMPGAAQVVRQLDASQVRGYVTSLTVSDDGTVALLQSSRNRRRPQLLQTAAGFLASGSTSLWMVNASGAIRQLPVDSPTAAAFFVNRTDAIVADAATQSASIILDVGSTATPIPLIAAVDGLGAISSIAASPDGSRVFLADADSGNIGIVDVQTGTSALIACGCRPRQFSALKGNSVFRLNDALRDPIMVLDASGATSRIVIIPPYAPAVPEAQ
jgi:hypothetical protein